MKRFILSLAMLLSVAVASAQVPGYLGKKHMFIYTPSLSLFTNTYRVDNTSAASMFFLSHNLQYVYVVKKRGAVSLFYETAGMNVYAGAKYRGGLDEYIFADYRKHQVGVAYRKYFRTANLAPLGAYMKYSVSVINATAKMMDASIPYATELAQDRRMELVTERSYWDFTTGIGIGRQLIIAKYIPINFELDVNLPWATLFEIGGDGMEGAVVTNTMGNSMVKFNIGIGLLAF